MTEKKDKLLKETLEREFRVNCSRKQMPEEHLNKIKNLTSIL